jgi:hypothetical protein
LPAKTVRNVEAALRPDANPLNERSRVSLARFGGNGHCNATSGAVVRGAQVVAQPAASVSATTRTAFGRERISIG